MKHSRSLLVLVLTSLAIGLACQNVGPTKLGLAPQDKVPSKRAAPETQQLKDVAPDVLEQSGRVERHGRLWILASPHPIHRNEAQKLCARLAGQEERDLTLPSRGDVIDVLLHDVALARVLERLDTAEHGQGFHVQEEGSMPVEQAALCVSPMAPDASRPV